MQGDATGAHRQSSVLMPKLYMLLFVLLLVLLLLLLVAVACCWEQLFQLRNICDTGVVVR